MSVLKVKEPAAHKPRPYWHVDVKWVSGLVLCLVLAVWLLLMVAYQATQRETAIQLMTNMITVGMKQGSSEENKKALDALRKQIAESPTKSIQPFPGFPATITEADLSLSYEKFRDKIFRQVVEPLYDKGARKLAEEQTKDKAKQDKFVKDASALSLFTKEGHDRIGGFVIIGGLVVLAVAAAAVFFSHGFGRIVTPAVVLLVVSLPGLILFSGLHAAASQPPDPNVEPKDYVQLVLSARGAFVPLTATGQQVYLAALLTALGLLVAAALGKLGHALLSRYRLKGETRKAT
jgi:hypothetical protein